MNLPNPFLNQFKLLASASCDNEFHKLIIHCVKMGGFLFALNKAN